MAYRSNGTFSLPCTVSYLPNNLSCVDNNVIFVKFNEVHVCNFSTGESRKITLSTKTSIFQAKVVSIQDDLYVVVASTDGTLVYLADNLDLVFFLPIGVSAKEDSIDPPYACGVASNSTDRFVFTGTSNGNITAILVPSSASGRDATFHSTLPTSDFPIFCLASSYEIIAAGNDNGDVFAFSNIGTDFAPKSTFNGSGYPCTSICAQGYNVFAAFSLGNIRVYDTSRDELKIEVTAHARNIYGLCVHPTLPILASCSEDQRLHVWSPDCMDLLSTHVLENQKLTGVSFLPRNCLGVSSYDSDDIALFTTP